MVVRVTHDQREKSNIIVLHVYKKGGLDIFKIVSADEIKTMNGKAFILDTLLALILILTLEELQIIVLLLSAFLGTLEEERR